MTSQPNFESDLTAHHDGEQTPHTIDVNMTSEQNQASWMRRNLLKISAAAFIGGSAVTVAVNPMDKIEHEVITAAPWIGAGLISSEAMWIGGAAVMAGSTGRRIGNPLTLKSRYGEISQSVTESTGFKTGLAINTIGALGTASLIAAGAVTSLPVETWPGAVGIATADMAGTIALRSGIYMSIKGSKKNTDSSNSSNEKTKSPKVSVREATVEDIDRLADIDILLFDKAYGEEKPDKNEVVDMLEQRLANNPGWMFVSEVDGEVEGFVTAFRTNSGVDDFESWEESTANGTLEGKVVPDGKYVYVANMTIKHEAVELGAEDMLLANLFANGIRDGVEYGYFVSRMPHFKRWMQAQDIEPTKDNARKHAQTYLELRREEDGKRQDPQLRMYEGYGFKLKRMVPEAFEDDASMDYGVVFKAAVPPSPALKKIKPVRTVLAGSLRTIAKHPTILKKVF